MARVVGIDERVAGDGDAGWGLGGPERANQIRFASSCRKSGCMRPGVSFPRAVIVASVTIWEPSSSRRRALPGASSWRRTRIAWRSERR